RRTARPAPARGVRDRRPSTGAPPTAASGVTGLGGEPPPPDISVLPLIRARSLFIVWPACSGLARYLAISTGLGKTARSFRRPSLKLMVTSAFGCSLPISTV